MPHKGLIYTIAIVACLAFFISLIAYSVNTKVPTSFSLDSYPSGAKVYLKGELLGKTPLTLDESFFRKHDVNIDKANIFRLFTPTPKGIEIIQKKGAKGAIRDRSPLLLTFEIPTKKGAIPARFSKTNSPGADYSAAQLRAFVSHDMSNRMIVSFDLDKLAPIDEITKSQAAIVLFVPANRDVPLSHMSEYKTFKRVSTPPEK